MLDHLESAAGPCLHAALDENTVVKARALERADRLPGAAAGVADDIDEAGWVLGEEFRGIEVTKGNEYGAWNVAATKFGGSADVEKERFCAGLELAIERGR